MYYLQKGLSQEPQELHSDSIYALYSPLLYEIVRHNCLNLAETIFSSALLQEQSYF